MKKKIHWRHKDPTDLPSDDREVLLLTNTGNTRYRH